MIRVPAVLVAALASAAVASTAAAQEPARARPAARPSGFSSAEREAIVAYFKSNPLEVKPLPPGIAKNLQRGKRLPPGIAKRQPPAGLLERLPERNRAEAGVEVTIFSDRIVLLEATGLVVDIIEGVFGR